MIVLGSSDVPSVPEAAADLSVGMLARFPRGGLTASLLITSGGRVLSFLCRHSENLRFVGRRC